MLKFTGHMIKKFLSLIVGTLSIIIGFLGLLLPLIPGWLLIFFGILIISPFHGQKIISFFKEKIINKIRKK